MNTTVYFLLRLGAGVSFFGHGLVRLPKLAGFADWMSHSFQEAMLPGFIVTPFAYSLPLVEFFVGLLLLFGLFTKFALKAGASIMLLLIFGTCLIENWEAIPSQLLHLAFCAVLLQFIDSNNNAVDTIMNKKQ
ncbi:DoxX family membrane protein [Flavobacterium sp. RHBU_24]|uniref:DoxX family membrane protein n=1 Tax=Flavobacterium sp. RHBU_24 TaxID=3391185 RepID=UPI003984D2C0